MKMKRLFNYKNTDFDNELASIVHNFAVKHDPENNVSEITIYGLIGDSWYSDGTTASDVDNALKEASGKDVLIRLNSQGGSAFDGISIFNRLLSYKEQHNAKIKVHVDGYACSAASLIPCAADEVIMGTGSMLMIHEASTAAWGNKSNLRAQADLLEKLEDGIIDIYQTKANISREELREKVDAETWFNAREAVEIGLATSTALNDESENNEVVNSLKDQLDMLRKEMEEIKNIQKKETTQKVEQPPTNKRNRFLF